MNVTYYKVTDKWFSTVSYEGCPDRSLGKNPVGC